MAPALPFLTVQLDRREQSIFQHFSLSLPSG
jgi:hypothetical protein